MVYLKVKNTRQSKLKIFGNRIKYAADKKSDALYLVQESIKGWMFM